MNPTTIFKKSTGLNVGVSPGSLDYDFENGISQLQVAVNVDINDSGYVCLTNGGYTQLESGEFYSLWQDEQACFVCKNNFLYKVNNDLTLKELKNDLSGNWVYFCQVGKETYFSDSVVMGRIIGEEVFPWLNTTYKSPSDRDIIPVKPGKNLTFSAGRILFTIGNVLFWTELHLLGVFSPAHNNIVFESDINVIAKVENGLFVSTDNKTWFLQGTDPHSFKQTLMPVGPAIHNHSVAMQTRDGFQLGLNQPGQCIFFTTDYGAAIGTPGGEIIIMNENTVMYPDCKTGATVLHGNQLRQVLY